MHRFTISFVLDKRNFGSCDIARREPTAQHEFVVAFLSQIGAVST